MPGCSFAIAFLIAMLYFSPVWGHSVDARIEPAHGYRITALYDDGEPMSYAAVEIKAPDGQIVFQTGRTDRNGRFLFETDRSGRWQAVIADGMGHRAELAVEVTDSPDVSGSLSVSSAGRPAGSRWRNLVTGLAIILGVFGFFYGWTRRRKR